MRKHLVADITFKFLDPSMPDSVPLQIRLVCEVSITHRAFVRFLFGLFRVNTLVFLEETGRHTNLITFITLVQLSTV